MPTIKLNGNVIARLDVMVSAGFASGIAMLTAAGAAI
jgi:hypothetical protein